MKRVKRKNSASILWIKINTCNYFQTTLLLLPHESFAHTAQSSKRVEQLIPTVPSLETVAINTILIFRRRRDYLRLSAKYMLKNEEFHDIRSCICKKSVTTNGNRFHRFVVHCALVDIRSRLIIQANNLIV